MTNVLSIIVNWRWRDLIGHPVSPPTFHLHRPRTGSSYNLLSGAYVTRCPGELPNKVNLGEDSLLKATFVVSVLWVLVPPSWKTLGSDTNMFGSLFFFLGELQILRVTCLSFPCYSRFLYGLLDLLTDTQDFELQLGHELMKLVLTALTRRCSCLWYKQVITADHSH